jgi:hypothetical protein
MNTQSVMGGDPTHAAAAMGAHVTVINYINTSDADGDTCFGTEEEVVEEEENGKKEPGLLDDEDKKTLNAVLVNVLGVAVDDD